MGLCLRCMSSAVKPEWNLPSYLSSTNPTSIRLRTNSSPGNSFCTFLPQSSPLAFTSHLLVTCVSCLLKRAGVLRGQIPSVPLGTVKPYNSIPELVLSSPIATHLVVCVSSSQTFCKLFGKMWLCHQNVKKGAWPVAGAHPMLPEPAGLLIINGTTSVVAI